MSEVKIAEDLQERYETLCRGTCEECNLPRTLIERVSAAESALAEAKAENVELSKDVSEVMLQRIANEADTTAIYEAEITALRAENERLRAPVSDEEPDLCEGCDKPLREDEGHETGDSVMLCDECWEGMAADPSCHAEECECELCLAARSQQPPTPAEQERPDPKE